MRNLKKFLALVLAFVMAMSLMVTANAATTNTEFSDSESVTEAFEEDITVLNGMGIIKGYEDGTFGPGRPVTRAQMAAFVYRIATGDASDTRTHAYVGYNTFSDVDTNAWYAGYIGYCANAEYIVGYPDGTFRPNNNVTGYAALAMILRAMGYNEPGHNFVGNGWEVTVSSTATQIGMLQKISQTTYNATLKQNAPRELVAEMLFQGLIKPTVVWTAAYGYQSNSFVTNGQSLDLNLGWTNYGLTNNKGVVVGNEVTGEGEHVTKVGFDVVNNRITNDVDSWTSYAYVYGNAGYYETDSSGNPTTNWVSRSTTRAFNWDTDLYDFGHAMDVWYNNNPATSNYNGANLTTYAMFDRVSKTDVVAVDGSGLSDATLATPANTGLRKALADAGFSVNTNNAGNGFAFLNYAFGPTKAVDNAVTATNYQSPIKVNNGTDDHQLYLAISNSNGTVDMIVALDMTITEVTQMNNVAAPKTLGVYNANGSGTSYFDTMDTVTGTYTTTYANIAQKNLLKSTGTNLGDKVVAMTITGTAPGFTGGTHTQVLEDGFTTANTGNVPAVSPLTSTYYYQLTKLTKVVPGTVINIDTANQDVYLSNGSVLHKSIFADAVDGTFQDNDHVNAPVFFSTYNFYLDEKGEYIFWEPIVDSTKFVYGTYLDYTTPLNSSSYTYSMVGVGIDGKQVVESPVTSYNTTAAWTTWNTFANAANYNANALPKRDATGSSGYVLEGQYVGYTIDSDGVLSAVTPESGAYGGTASQPVIQASTADFDRPYTTTSGDLEITANDAKIGAATVVATTTTEPGLFLTTNTRIYLVSGAGTDTQKVEIYEGIGKLLEGNDKVIINGDGVSTLAAGSLKADVKYSDMIYYTKSPFTYAQNYVNSAYEVKEIFIPKQAVTMEKSVSGNLFFVGNASGSVVNAIGETATRYTVYDTTGTASNRWIRGDYRIADGNDAYLVNQNNSNVFYTLLPTGKTAQDGEPIYSIAAVNKPDDAVIGSYWNGTSVDQTTNPGSGNVAAYKATTYSMQVAFIDQAGTPNTLYNVDGAKVMNLNTRAYPGITDLTTLNQAGSLTDNTGVPVSCVLGENGGVATIFVNAANITPYV